MKWTCLKIITIGLFSIAIAQNAFAHTPIFYSMAHARLYQKKHGGSFYVQLGSFSQLSNAQRFKKRMQITHKTPVSMQQKNGYYIVLTGPFNAANKIKNKNTTTIQKTNISRTKPQQPFAEPTVRMKEAPLPLAPSMLESSNWFITAGGGSSNVSVPSSMTVGNDSGFSSPFNLDNYSVKTNHPAVFTAEAGRQWQRDSTWLSAYSFGLSYQHLFNTQVNGSVMQFSLPEFTNYHYEWDLSANVLMAFAKLNFFRYGSVSPYIRGGLGVTRNTAENYIEAALPDVTARTSPDFTNNSTTTLALNAGAGVDVALPRQFFLSLGYSYLDLGKIRSGPGTAEWAAQSLSIKSWQANELLLTLSYQLPV